MSFTELFLIAVSLAFDVGVVSVGAGVFNTVTLPKALRVAAVFGALHAFMLVAGWVFGNSFSTYLAAYGSIIGFVLMLLVGLKMLKDAFAKEPVEEERSIFRNRILLPLALATSLDALVIGISFTFMEVSIVTAAALTGIVTFAVSLIGLWIGTHSRHLLGPRIGVLGALILIALAFKILFA